ncbi:MAG: hypothetical protein COB90_10170 [Hyphomicrobiales bacterium]|nr:MAG: hypothetical protein COB90_10170 [Hyphomicrobiales bacterium]
MNRSDFPAARHSVEYDEIMDLKDVSFLVVDDKKFMCDLVRGMLKAFGARKVHSMIDVQDIPKYLDQQRIDVLILDWVMPGTGGAAILRDLRLASNPMATTPCIVLTGYANRSCIDRAVDGGADMILLKPLSAKMLYTRICNLIESNRQYIQVGDYLGPVTKAHHNMLDTVDDGIIENNTGAEYWLVQP